MATNMLLLYLVPFQIKLIDSNNWGGAQSRAAAMLRRKERVEVFLASDEDASWTSPG